MKDMLTGLAIVCLLVGIVTAGLYWLHTPEAHTTAYAPVINHCLTDRGNPWCGR